MRSYGFAAVAKHADASLNELKHWVQPGVIRPDVRETSGTGAHRTFGFLDVFEACVARKLNALPGGTPIHFISRALDAIRFETALPDSPWRAFLDPATRRSKTQHFWLCLVPGQAPRVLDRGGCDLALRDGRDAIVLVRLDTLLFDLEARTNDHSSDEERSQAWTKRDPSVVDVVDTPTASRAPRPAGRRLAAKTKSDRPAARPGGRARGDGRA